MLLTELNDDVLRHIFEKCSISEVIRLYYVCKRFQAIVSRYTFLKKSLDLLLVGHRNPDTPCFKRTLHDLSYHKRVKLFQNWCYGRYEEHVMFHQKQFNPSRIHLEKELLYITHGGQLRVHKRVKNRQILSRKPCKTYGIETESDITSFTKKDGTIFIGRRDGHVTIISTDSNDTPILNERIDTTNTNRLEYVDFDADLFVTTTLNTTSLWRRQYELGIPFLEPIAQLNGGGNKCLRLSPDAERLASGKYNERARTALRLVDIETRTEQILNSDTSSVYDLLWKDNQTILTGNYDTTFRLFDCRTNSDQWTWTDPYDLAVYCMQYDGNHAVLCGMKYHCRVNLYDLRVPNKYIQLYFPSMRIRGASGSSPAYSVANDQSQLFIATDHNLRVFDFDADWAEPKDYTNIFVHELIAYAY